MIDNKPSTKDMIQLWQLCANFIRDNRIYDGETVYQADRVIENAYEFMHGVCNIVGFEEYDEDEE